MRPGVEAALEAARNGISVIPIREDGSKAAMVTWAPYQDKIADPLTIEMWGHQTDSFAWVGGEVSERLICVDIEGRFWSEHRDDLLARLNSAGLLEVVTAWTIGCCNTTPSGGVHIWIRLMGDDPVPGNTKIAMAADASCLIETRGRGGYAIAAPANGSTHPSGRAWASFHGGCTTIEWVPPEIYDAVLDVLASFDETPPSPPPPAPRPLRVVGDSWIDQALESVQDLTSTLIAHGWTYVRSDARGQLWRRPGKNIGVSGRLNNTGRLHVFSTSTPLAAGKTTYDALDVILAYRLGRAPSSDERVAELRAYRSEPGGGNPRLLADPAQRAAVAEPVDHSLNLPVEWWQESPILASIYEQSLGLLLSPDAVLGDLLAEYATTIPMRIWLPALVGAPAPLNLYSVLVAKSGGGKTAAMTTAHNLLGWNRELDRDVRLRTSLRSGEGLVNLVNKKPQKDSDVIPHYTGVHVHYDEGGTFAKQAMQTASTHLTYLNTAWSGAGLVGGAKASENGSFDASEVRIGATIGVQYGAAANLFRGEAQVVGFPQRLLFFGLEHPEIANQTFNPERPELKPLPLRFWSHSEFRARMFLEIPEAIAREVFYWTQNRSAATTADPYDSHLMNLRLRTAGVLALMHDSRGDFTTYWALSEPLCSTSRNVRSHLVSSFQEQERERSRAMGRADVERQDGAREVLVEKAVLSLARAVRARSEPMDSKQIKSSLGYYRQSPRSLDYREILAIAMARQYVIRTEHGYEVGPVPVGGVGV